MVCIEKLVNLCLTNESLNEQLCVQIEIRSGATVLNNIIEFELLYKINCIILKYIACTNKLTKPTVLIVLDTFNDFIIFSWQVEKGQEFGPQAKRICECVNKELSDNGYILSSKDSFLMYVS